ncbi:MAG: twin-arginine translocation signal domain-containing protein [Helicobacteraceae bacterium]|nr:twin-arginine translocation signal domain-containing protein [Helicobacteraceae bacterium]
MNPRRKFLKDSAKVGVAAVATGVAISACSNSTKTQQEVFKGKSKKQEVLYQKSPYWEAYYKVAY